MKLKFALLLSISLIGTAFSASPREEARHFGAFHVNVPISISVSDDVDRESRAFANLVTSGGAEPFQKAIAAIPGDLRDYLVENEIEVAESAALRHLHVSVKRISRYFLIQGGQEISFLVLSAEATYSPVTGEPITFDLSDFQVQYSDPEAAAPALARAAIDKALLIWQPDRRAARIKPPTGKSDGIGLFATSPTGADRPAPYDQPVVLSWETFPSDRILTASAVTPADIEDVSYELRYRPYRGSPLTVAPGMAQRSVKSQTIILTDTSLDLGSQLPWCGEITWSVRARFQLDGHPRLTQWSTRNSLLPDGMGHVTRVGAPNGFECFQGNGNIVAAKPIGAAAAWSSRAPVQLGPLEAGEAVASILLTGSRCDLSENPCSAEVYRENNRTLRGQMQRIIDGIRDGIQVQDGGDFIDPAWFGDERDAFEIDLAGLHQWLADDSNRASLENAGIRRVLAIHTDDTERLVGITRTSEGGLISADEPSDLVYGSSTTTTSSLVVHADIIDVETGERLVRLDVAAQGRDTQETVWLLIVPISFSYGSDAFEKGIELITSVGAHALMGARIGWPADFLEDIY